MTNFESSSEADPLPPDDRTQENAPNTPNGPTQQDEGPGWLPAIMAGGLVVLMATFICCGVSTAYLWNQRGELASRTLRGHTIAMIEQSQLPPEEKQAINGLLTEVAEQIEAGQLEDWQASAIMGRLQRLPLVEWGDLAAVEAMIRSSDQWDATEKQNAARQLSRIRHAVVIGHASHMDLHDVLEPVRRESPQAPSGTRMVASPTRQQLAEVINRATLVSDRLEIEDKQFDDVSLSTLVRQQIEAGRSEGEL